MRVSKILRKDQEIILRFLDAFGGGAAALGAGNKYARADFFVLGSAFMQEYVTPVFFRKEEMLMKALEDSGFPTNSGAIGSVKNDQEKCKESADLLAKAAKAWQDGDADARLEVGWTSSEYTTTLRQNLDRLKNLVFPLIEQNIPPEDEQRILEDLGKVTSNGNVQADGDKFIEMIESLEEELSDWK